jgi:hypothetical protein|tara:strand:- start:20 stop:397 length:378 start_codon:yes stop_codon:yes gene_type:complete
MFQWDFDKPSTPVNFDTTISQDITNFNNFFSQNVAAQTNTQAPAMPPMNFLGSALSNFQEQKEQPIIDYMTYNAPQPTEPILMPQDRKNQTTGLRPEDKKNQQQPQTMGLSTGLLDAQEGLNPYG